MQVRALALTVWLPLLAAGAGGCKTTGAPALVAPHAAQPVSDLDQFESEYNRFVQLPDGDPQREAYRRVLLDYLLTYLDRALSNGDEDEGLTALQYATSLYSPAELRTTEPNPELAARGHALYRVAARRGAEDPSFLGLAVEQRFGDETARAEALENWELLETWITRNGPYATEPLLRHEELERSLEQVASVFPSPFVVERIADLYVARYELARQARSQGRAAGSAAQRRMEITGYLLMRAYLRADDFEGALRGMNRVELDMPVAKLRELMVDAMKPRRSALPLLALAEQFIPDPDADPAQPYVAQGWGIVDNLSRRAVHKYPKDAYAQLLRSRALAHAGLTEAAIVHLRHTIALKEDLFEAWQALAALEQETLEKLADGRPLVAERRLEEVEKLHARATDLWADRPIEPGLPAAYYTVAEGLYHAGEVSRSQALLERSLGVEPVPNSLDLLGTIALKQSKLEVARDRYEDLAGLVYDSETSQLQWEARARSQLGEIALRRGDAKDSTRHIRMALRHTNDLLARDPGSVDQRAERYVERGKLLFFLGDIELAMEDFRKAGELAPDNVKSYADPLRCVVAYGYYDQARAIFRGAMAQGDISPTLKLYFAIWVREMGLTRGETPEPEAVRFIAQYEGGRWGNLLARHARGEIGFEALQAGAKDRGEKAEAFFYEGLRLWRQGQTEEAKKRMKQVLDTQMMGFFEYDMAQAYLSWGEVPREARPALLGATASKR